MTPFAQLDERVDLEKSARGGLIRGLHGLVTNGLWKTLGQTAKPSHTGIRAFGNKASRAFYNPATNKSTGLGKGMFGYGLAGMVAPAAGINLPGSDLALASTMPGFSALFAAPNLITAGRLASDKNQQRIRSDALQGAQLAGGDLLAWSQQSPQVATKRDLYHQVVSQMRPGVSPLADYYRAGRYQPMGFGDQVRSVFQNPQLLLNNKVDQMVFNQMRKSGSEKSAVLGLIGRGLKLGGKGLGATAKNVLPWAGVGIGGAMTANSVLRDKPYDENEVMNRGYAAASTMAQQRLNQLSPMERFFIGLDPSLMSSKIEQALPGSLAMMRRVHGNVGKGGVQTPQAPPKHNYYTYDASGGVKYL